MTYGTIKLYQGKFKWNLLYFHVYCILLIVTLLGLLTYLEKDEYVFYRFILLLICMEIETNPGPNENEKDTVNTLDFFHLNARRMRNKLNYIHYIDELNFDLLTSCTENCNTEQNKYIILAVRYPKIFFIKFSKDDFDSVKGKYINIDNSREGLYLDLKLKCVIRYAFLHHCILICLPFTVQGEDDIMLS